MCSEDNGIGVAVYQILVCVTLWHMSIRAGVVITVTFHQIDNAPHAEAGTDGDHQGLENRDSRAKEFHNIFDRNIWRG